MARVATDHVVLAVWNCTWVRVPKLTCGRVSSCRGVVVFRSVVASCGGVECGVWCKGASEAGRGGLAASWLYAEDNV